MSELFIGLISGTSMDAVDAVLVDFSLEPLKIISAHSESMPAELKRALIALCVPGTDEINRAGQLDVQVGNLFAQASENLLTKAKIKPQAIRAIGSHGQTIRHQPHFTHPFTLQIGDPNIISSQTGISTIADFRRRDMALGGQGAPLVPAFHEAIFRTREKNRMILNIGGIANITCLPADPKQAVIGFDTGPGNTLLDAWIFQHLQQEHDNNGAWGASGKIDKDLLNHLLADLYFTLSPPKSTGREYFNLSWLEKHKSTAIAPEDIQATLAELTVASIANAIKKFGLPDGEILICGGGVHNQHLLQRLTEHCEGYQLYSTAEFGIDPDWVEATCFAWLARQTLLGKPGNLPSVTGASKASVLGAIYPA